MAKALASWHEGWCQVAQRVKCTVQGFAALRTEGSQPPTKHVRWKQTQTRRCQFRQAFHASVLGKDRRTQKESSQRMSYTGARNQENGLSKKPKLPSSSSCTRPNNPTSKCFLLARYWRTRHICSSNSSSLNVCTSASNVVEKQRNSS